MRIAVSVALLMLVGWPQGASAQPTRGAPARSQALHAEPPERVVSLHPAATEILLALGAAHLLVARMDGDTPTERARASELAVLPSVGEMLTPDLEVLASVDPDLVIAWSDSDVSALSRVVERRGGRVETIGVDRLLDVPPAMTRIGGWIGRQEEASALVAGFLAKLERGRAERPSGRPPRVLWVVWADPIVAAGSGNFIHDVIELAGGVNTAASAGTPWPRLGMESLVALDPDVLVWPDGPGLFPADDLQERSGWRTLGAVEAGRVLVVDAERFHDAGPELADAALDFARRLAGAISR